jgi:outer membrane protein, multidrug efflux system
MTISKVIENVATAYFQLRTLDAELEITRRTLAARKESLQLTETLEQGGSGTLADVRQAEQLLYTAAAAIPDFERQIEQQENSLSILLGRNPGPIIREDSETNWPEPEQVSAGIPSQLLERRPDIQQAEGTLVAANADVGVAKAQMFTGSSKRRESGEGISSGPVWGRSRFGRLPKGSAQCRKVNLGASPLKDVHHRSPGHGGGY